VGFRQWLNCPAFQVGGFVESIRQGGNFILDHHPLAVLAKNARLGLGFYGETLKQHGDLNPRPVEFDDPHPDLQKIDRKPDPLKGLPRSLG
jgi:hypothetical protein